MLRKSEWPNYLLTYALVATTGLEYFYRYPEFMLLFMLLAMGMTIYRQTPLTVGPFAIVVVVFLVELLQAATFNNFNPVSLVTIMVRLLLVYFVVHVVGLRIVRYYTDIVCISALISLPIYAATFVPAIEQFLIKNIAEPFFRAPFSPPSSMYQPNPNMLVYTFNQWAEETVVSSVIKRNSGPFWEPGAFAAFMNLAVVFTVFHEKKLVTKRFILLTITIITTLSTAGYITLFLIVIGYVMVSNSLKAGYKVLLVAVAIPAAISGYTQTEFLSGKVKQNMSVSKEDNTSRFGSAFFDIKDMARSPLIGFGRLSENRFGQAARVHDLSIHRNNGLTFLPVTYGIPVGVVYFFMLFLFFRRYGRLHGASTGFVIISYLSLLSSGFSQVIFDRTFLIALVFLAIRIRQAEKVRIPAPNLQPETPDHSLSYQQVEQLSAPHYTNHY